MSKMIIKFRFLLDHNNVSETNCMLNTNYSTLFLVY